MTSMGVPPAQQHRDHSCHPLENIKRRHSHQHPATHAQPANPRPPRVSPRTLVRVWQHVEEYVGQQRTRRKASGNHRPNPTAFAPSAEPTKAGKSEDAH